MTVPMRLTIRMRSLRLEPSLVPGNSDCAASRDASRSDGRCKVDGSASVRYHMSRLGPCAFLADFCGASFVTPIIMIGGRQIERRRQTLDKDMSMVLFLSGSLHASAIALVHPRC